MGLGEGKLGKVNERRNPGLMFEESKLGWGGCMNVTQPQIITEKKQTENKEAIQSRMSMTFSSKGFTLRNKLFDNMLSFFLVRASHIGLGVPSGRK